ncbi:glutamate N-acetyltransferase, partial [Basidiobolus ranarum]
MSLLRNISKRSTCIGVTRIFGTYQSQRSYAKIVPEKLSESKLKLIPTSGEYPKGFKVTGIHCGVKKDPTRKDLALIYSEIPCNAAAVFTQNIFKAAPVIVTKQILDQTGGKNVNVLVANSGCANAVTGTRGLDNAKLMSTAAADVAGSKNGSLVMSTGVIGHHLPMKKILEGIKNAQKTLGEGHEAWLDISTAFMTTDTFPKLRSSSYTLPSGLTYRMAGVSKGAGMIHPNMATLLGMVATDAPVTSTCLKSALKYATDRSFNAISIDGDTSTNDTVAILANGASSQEDKHLIKDENSEDYQQFRQDLTDFTSELAKLVVRDGEGATKFVTISVENAKTFEEAKHVANTIATSALVKTAL